MRLLKEDGYYLLKEDGFYFLREDFGAETNIICWGFDSNPRNIILRPVFPKAPAPLRMLHLTRTNIMPTFPPIWQVVAGVKYGPTGTEFTGTYIESGGGGAGVFPIIGGKHIIQTE